MSKGSSKHYVIGHEDEHDRLERQARIGKIEKHLEKFTVPVDAVILDAGCGSGSMTRLLATAAADGRAIGVDTNKDYLAYAQNKAAAEGIRNISFEQGDIFSLPFDDDTFDLVWSRYVLQWVNDPIHAVEEFKRVTRPGRKIVCCNFDGFGVTHYPIDAALQADTEVFFNNAIDPFVGRKLFSMFHQCGLANITVDFEPDAAFTVSGKIDSDRRQNWADQFDAALSAAANYFGSEDKARSFFNRFLEYQDREDTLSICNLYFVEGTVA